MEFESEYDNAKLMRLFSRKNLPSILGSEKFKNRIKEGFKDFVFNEEIPESKALMPDIKRIKKTVCAAYKVKEASLYGVKRAVLNEPRNAAIYLARLLRRDSLKDIGKEFKIDNYSSVSSIIENMKKIVKKNARARNRVDKIKKGLI